LRIETRRRLSLFFSRGHGCGKALNYKGIQGDTSKKSPNTRLGLNPPKEEGGGDMRRLPNKHGNQ